MSEQGIPAVQESVDSENQQPQTAREDALAALRAKLELVQRDNLAKGEANKALNERLGESEKRLRELEGQMKASTQQSLESNGEYKALWQDASSENAKLLQRISELESAITDKERAISAERLKATAMSAISNANAVAPEQLYGLLQSQLRDSDGTPTVIVNGIEQPLTSYLDSLKSEGSGWDHHFAATGARGMGTRANAAPGAIITNPYKSDTLNMTEAFRLEAENPELARRLRAEAGCG